MNENMIFLDLLYVFFREFFAKAKIKVIFHSSCDFLTDSYSSLLQFFIVLLDQNQN